MIAATTLRIFNRDIAFSIDLDTSNICDASILEQMEMGKPCEPELCNVFARALREGDCAVDGGANVGFLTLVMSRLVGPSGHIYAFEPGSNNLPKLRRNLALNGCENVELIDRPLWSKARYMVQLNEHDHGGYNSFWADLSKQVVDVRTVETTTLDTICLDRPPKLIKLDIEGAELAALEGARILLQTKPYIIVEMNEASFDRAGVSLESLREFLSERGYSAFMLFYDGNLPALIPPKTKIAPMRLNANVMFSTIDAVETLWPEVYV